MRHANPTQCSICLKWWYKRPGYCNFCRQAWNRCQNDPSWAEVGGPPDREAFETYVQGRLERGQSRYPYRPYRSVSEWQLDVWNSGPEEETHPDSAQPVDPDEVFLKRSVWTAPGLSSPLLKLSLDVDGNLVTEWD